MSRLLIASLSFLGPLLVVAGSLRACSTFENRAAANEARNAGRILNGKVADATTAEVIERVLEQRPPELLVLGPSYANTNVSPDILSERLGIPTDRIVMLSVPNSVGAHWYAMLKYRLFEQGRRPQRQQHAGAEPDRHLRHPLAQHEPNDIASLSAHSHSHTDLPRPLNDPERHHPVQSERGEKERDRAAHEEQDAEPGVLRVRGSDDLVERQNARE